MVFSASAISRSKNALSAIGGHVHFLKILIGGSLEELQRSTVKLPVKDTPLDNGQALAGRITDTLGPVQVSTLLYLRHQSLSIIQRFLSCCLFRGKGVYIWELEN